MINFKARKFPIFVCIVAVGLLGTAFQNFAPHDPFAGNDTSDIYMNEALTKALEQAEKDGTGVPKALNGEAEMELKVSAGEGEPGVDSPTRKPANE